MKQNKRWEIKKCKEKGISTVPFFTSLLEALKASKEGAVWGRKLNHTQGKDIIIYPWYNLKFIPKKRDFYTVEIQKAKEYRVHVFCGRAVRSGTKIKEQGTYDGPIWNLGHGYSIRYEHPATKAAWELAKESVEACGLDFAAVDILEDKDGKVYFLELNTRPGLHGNTCEKYASKIMKAAKELEP